MCKVLVILVVLFIVVIMEIMKTMKTMERDSRDLDIKRLVVNARLLLESVSIITDIPFPRIDQVSNEIMGSYLSTGISLEFYVNLIYDFSKSKIWMFNPYYYKFPEKYSVHKFIFGKKSNIQILFTHNGNPFNLNPDHSIGHFYCVCYQNQTIKIYDSCAHLIYKLCKTCFRM